MKNTRFFTLLFFTLLFSATSLLSQKEGNVWHFGFKAGLNFNNPGNIIDTNSAMETIEGSAAISDADGNLLFYTNGGGRDPIASGQPGGAIYNRNHEVMYDMNGVDGGGWSSAQSSIVVPKPDDPGNYYLFTMEEVEFDVDGTPSRGFSYFEIDMDQNGGLGDVVNYQEALVVNSFEALTGTLHANGKDYWIVIVDYDEVAYKVYAVTAAGVSLSGTFPLGFSVATSGVARISPDGTKFAMGNFLYDFNNATGTISNFINLPQGTSSVTFSPNSRYLYTIDNNTIIRYDMTAANVPGSLETLFPLTDQAIYGQMQVAPDGNLYFSEWSFISFDTTYLSAILCPNAPSPCLRNRIYGYPNESALGGFIGMTNFTDHYFRNDVINQPLLVGITPEALQLCDNQTATLTAASLLGETYLWSTGATTPAITINAPGTYTVTVSSGCCATGTASVIVAGPGALDITISGDTLLCTGETSVELTASAPGSIGFLWNTGATTPNILADAIGTYTVTAIGACDDTATDSINVAAPEPFTLETYQSNTLACEGRDTLRVTTTAGGILWSTGDTTQTIVVDSVGAYSVTVTNGCESQTATFEVVLPEETERMIPNAFTPDGDGTNDVFLPLYDCPAVSGYEFRIYNRWGREVFKTTVPTAGWDGKVEGEPGTSDVYVYVVSYRTFDNVAVNRHGDVTLVR
ncbi:MAG: gliding motility-associated C-terminal domain-containing protein [Saprospiraceae bacterium]|nr:gliding motility-associated C-terminal domain-containing protein [Saprospiraceae bacterium]